MNSNPSSGKLVPRGRSRASARRSQGHTYTPAGVCAPAQRPAPGRRGTSLGASARTRGRLGFWGRGAVRRGGHMRCLGAPPLSLAQVEHCLVCEAPLVTNLSQWAYSVVRIAPHLAFLLPSAMGERWGTQLGRDDGVGRRVDGDAHDGDGPPLRPHCASMASYISRIRSSSSSSCSTAPGPVVL